MNGHWSPGNNYIVLILCSVLLALGSTVAYGANLVCEVEVAQAHQDEDKGTIASIDSRRVAEELEFEMYYSDPDLFNTWNFLFGVNPGTSANDILTLQGPENLMVTWDAGVLEMGGLMKIRVKADKKDIGLKEVKIEMPCQDDGTTLFISGTGAVNPNLADAGWHGVEVENMDNVKVTFNGQTITGFLKKLDVELGENSSTTNPIVKEFELEIKGITSAPDVKKGTVTSVIVEVPGTVVKAIAGIEYEEEIEEKSILLGSEVEAEFERESNALQEGVDIASLLDGNNDQLKEREGPCSIAIEGGGPGGD